MQQEQTLQNEDLEVLSECKFTSDLINKLNPESHYQYIVSQIQIDDRDRSDQWELITNVETHLKNNLNCSLIFYKSLLVCKICTELSDLQINLKIHMSSLQNSFVGYIITYASKLLLKPLLHIETFKDSSAGYNLLIQILRSKTKMLKRKKEYIANHMIQFILSKRVNRKKVEEILSTQYPDFITFKPNFRQVINFLYAIIYKYSKYTQKKTKYYRLLLRLVYATSIHHLQYDNLHIFVNLQSWLQKYGHSDIGSHLQQYIQSCDIIAAKDDINYIMHTHFAKIN